MKVLYLILIATIGLTCVSMAKMFRGVEKANETYDRYRYHVFHYGEAKTDASTVLYVTRIGLFSSSDKSREKYWDSTFGLFGQIGRYKKEGEGEEARFVLKANPIELSAGDAKESKNHIKFALSKEGAALVEANEMTVENGILNEQGYFSMWYWRDFRMGSKRKRGLGVEQRRFDKSLRFQTSWVYGAEEEKKDIKTELWVKRDGDQIILSKKEEQE